MTLRIRGVRYARLGTRDLDAAAGFASRVIGLQEVGRVGQTPGSRAAYFKSDRRHHSLVYVEGDPHSQVLGLEVDASVAELKAAARDFETQGLRPRMGTREECALRNVSALLALDDPSGNPVEIAVAATGTDAEFAPPRLAGIQGFGHVGLRSIDPARDEAFWTGVLGAQVSDRVGPAPMLRFNENHHQVALLPAARAGIQHLAFQLGSIDDVMRSWYHLRDNGIRIPFGPGREPTSSAVFVFFEGPEGVMYEYYAGARAIKAEANQRPRHFPFAPRSFCMWGGRPDMPEFNPPRQDGRL